jgi:hypothetical protein
MVLAVRGGDGGAGEHIGRSSMLSVLSRPVSSLAAGGGGKSASDCGIPENARWSGIVVYLDILFYRDILFILLFYLDIYFLPQFKFLPSHTFLTSYYS